MKSKNTLLLLVVLLVVAGAAYYLFKQKDRKSTIAGPDSEFAVTDTAAVDKIFISTKDGRNHTLVRKGEGQWMIDNKYEARQDMVNMLMETINKMRMKKPVSNASRNNVIRTLGARGIKVEVYKNNQLAKQFYVGGTTSDDLGTYFIMQGSENPYVVHIPGFDGFLESRFDMHLKDWRRVPVFHSAPASIEQLTVKYNKNPEQNFTIVNTPNGFDVKELPQEDQETIKRYLMNYVNVNGEFFVPDMHGQMRDSLELLTPVYEITLKDREAARSNSIKLYRNPDTEDRMLGITSQFNEVMSVQDYVLRHLLVDKEHFKGNNK